MSSPSRTKVAFLGPLGTYSHQVTSDFFGPSIELIPVEQISHVFSQVSLSQTKYGVVPIDNSTIGSVLETSLCLRTTNLSVRAMVALPIGHALLGLKTVDLKSPGGIKRVYSHEQGLGQCATYLSTHYPKASIIECTSTAAAAVLAAGDSESLAICSIKCAEVYGLQVVDRDIQDGGVANTTRFVVLSKSDVVLDDEFPSPAPVVTDTKVTEEPPLGG